MRINSADSTAFGVNLNSPKLRYSQRDFFVRIRGYGKNPLWANKIKETADTAVSLVRKDTSAENVLKFITAGIRNANQFCLDLYKRSNSGVLRTHREGWKSEEFLSGDIITNYDGNRYSCYKERLDETYYKPLSNVGIGMTCPNQSHILVHADSITINNSLDRVFKLSKKIFPKYIHKEVKQKNMAKINENIAEIRWILAHATPWSRGSDAISNVFIRVMYKAIGVKAYPLKKGVSLDLEAYCTELAEYKKRFSEYFEKPPEIIE